MASGPDQIIDSDDLSTWKRDGSIKIRTEKSGRAAVEPYSIITFVKKNCQLGGNRAAMMVKRDGKWIQWTYNQLYKDIRTAAKALLKLGLDRFSAVSIFGFNSPEWFLGCVGSIFAGGLACGLYPTNSAEMNKFIMQDSRTNILIVEDEAALKKIWSGAQEVSSLKKIVQFSGTPKKPGVLSWAEFMKIGQDEDDEALEETIKTIAINQCAVLIYTSGTTGNPKGVMLSHDNVTYTTDLGIEIMNWRPDSEVVVSYLPLSHIAGQLVDLWAPIGCRGTVWFADKMALKGSLLTTLQECRPTQFFGVPRVWEKIMEGMLEKGKALTGLKKKISAACKEAGLQYNLEGKNTPVFKIGQKIYYSKVREALGLDRCKQFYSAAAPLGPETMKYFMSLNIIIQELYGMSETTGPHHLTLVDHVKLGSVGKVMDSCRSRLANPNEDGEGELCMWGRNIMMGYMGREDKTTEDLDPEGWLHSGDLATFDKDGFCYITGRIKELIITAGGENVAPVPVEELIKKELPIVSNAILIGDKKKFLTVFLTLKTVVDKDTELPTKELTPIARDWCSSIGSKNVRSIDQILQGPDPRVMAAIQAGIDKVNSKAVSNAAKVQKWTVLPLDLSVKGGELGPTLKLKRFAFTKKFAHAVENLYV